MTVKINNQIEPNARRGVSPSLDPGNMNQFADALSKSGLGKRALAAGQRALTAMHSAMTEFEEARELVSTNKSARMRTQPSGLDVRSSHIGDVRSTGKSLRAFSGHEGKLVDAAKQRFDSVGREVQAQVDILTDVQRDATRLMDEAIAHKTEPHIAGEIRRHIATMNATERMAFISGRIDAEDRATVSAVLGAPEFLSGLGSDATDTLRNLARRQFAPEAHGTHEAATRSFEFVCRAIDTFVGDFHDGLKAMGPGESELAGKIQALKGGAA